MNTNDLTERLQNFQQRASDAAKNACSATDDYVRDNVWTSVALGAVVGCVIGFLLGRSRD